MRLSISTFTMLASASRRGCRRRRLIAADHDSSASWQSHPNRLGDGPTSVSGLLAVAIADRTPAMVRRLLICVALLGALCLPVAADAATGDIARYVLPPGNYGGIPTDPHSFDQLSLYSGL